MLPKAAGRGQHFQARGHNFSLYGPTLSRQITYLFFPVIKLGYQCLCNFVFELAYAPAVYKPLTKNLRNEQVSINSDTRKRKMYFKKNRFISNYFMLLAFSSPVKLSKRVVSV